MADNDLLLVEFGKLSNKQDDTAIMVAGLALDLAVIKEKISDLPDHESRIRSLERWKNSLPITLLLSIASVAAVIFEALHHH